jgi:hypothetical protein
MAEATTQSGRIAWRVSGHPSNLCETAAYRGLRLSVQPEGIVTFAGQAKVLPTWQWFIMEGSPGRIVAMGGGRSTKVAARAVAVLRACGWLRARDGGAISGREAGE